MCQILVNLRSKDLRRKSNRTVAVTEGVDELPDEDSPARLFRDVDAWQSGVTQNVTWWKDVDSPTLILVK